MPTPADFLNWALSDQSGAWGLLALVAIGWVLDQLIGVPLRNRRAKALANRWWAQSAETRAQAAPRRPS